MVFKARGMDKTVWGHSMRKIEKRTQDQATGISVLSSGGGGACGGAEK